MPKSVLRQGRCGNKLAVFGVVRLGSLDFLVYYTVQLLIDRKRRVYEFFEVL